MSGSFVDLQSISVGVSHICIPLFVMFSYVSQSLLSSNGLCTSYQSDHSHVLIQGVVDSVGGVIYVVVAAGVSFVVGV